MSVIYRKSVKGVEEVAFKSFGLPMRLTSYLLAVDGESSVEQLSARHPSLPSLGLVLQGLLEQGFLELAGSSDKAGDRFQQRGDSGAPALAAGVQRAALAAQNYYQPVPAQSAQVRNQELELDKYKADMVRDVSVLLGADAAPVIQKIQACGSRENLFVTMMGIKKIIIIYKNRDIAEKFASRYLALSN